MPPLIPGESQTVYRQKNISLEPSFRKLFSKYNFNLTGSHNYEFRIDRSMECISSCNF